jgi:hypothetical protein
MATPEKRPSMVRRARRDTTAVVKERPVSTGIATLLVGAPIVVGTAVLEEDLPLGWQIGLLVASGGLGGFLAVLVALFIAKLLTARRHQLEDRVGYLEQTTEEQREQLLKLTQNQLGDRDRFIPTYIDMRTALRDACGKIEVAVQTRALWDRAAVFSTGPWDRNKDALGTHPWAREDGVYEPCSEAFSHVERLNRVGALRWKREVRAGDNLEGALEAIKVADETLTQAIRKSTPDQP